MPFFKVNIFDNGYVYDKLGKFLFFGNTLWIRRQRIKLFQQQRIMRKTNNIRACLKNRKRRLFAPKRSSSGSKSLVKRRFDCVFFLEANHLGSKIRHFLYFQASHSIANLIKNCVQGTDFKNISDSTIPPKNLPEICTKQIYKNINLYGKIIMYVIVLNCEITLIKQERQ